MAGPISAAKAHGQHGSEETSRRWLAVDGTASDLTGSGIERNRLENRNNYRLLRS